MTVRETTYYGKAGFLYPFDMRHNPQDRAFCDLLLAGEAERRLRLVIWTEPAFAEAVLVYNDGTPNAAPMRLLRQDHRFMYWEAVIQPAAPQITYSFAFRTHDGRPVYWCKQGVDHSVEILDRYRLDLTTLTPFNPPAWVKGAVIYQIFPERFANGDPTNDPPGVMPWGAPPRWLEFQGGDLQGITQHLDYLADLGVDILYLTPIFTSPSTHKYNCADFMHVDPAFGGDAALHALVAGLHSRGMKIVLDASFNHCDPRFFAFQDLIKHGADSPYRDWFTVHEWPIRIKHRPHITTDPRATRPMYRQYLEAFERQTGIAIETLEDEGAFVEATYLAWSGVLDMPKINLENPATRAYFLDVTRYWLREFKVDGWRMDVARHIVPDFWDDFRRAAKEVNPDCYLLAEIWGNTAPWLQGNQFDATMNYFFRDLAVDYFARQTMDTTTFVAGLNHMLALYAPQVTQVTHNLFSSHDVERFRYEAGEDIRRLRLATLFQLTLPGAPGVYYGDEIGMTGGFDPDCRRAFPWDQPETWDREMLDMTKTLIRLRKAHPALRLGEWRCIWQGPDALAYARTTSDERIVVVVNRGAALERVMLPVQAERAEVLWGEAEVTVGANGLSVQGLGAQTGVVVRV